MASLRSRSPEPGVEVQLLVHREPMCFVLDTTRESSSNRHPDASSCCAAVVRSRRCRPRSPVLRCASRFGLEERRRGRTRGDVLRVGAAEREFVASTVRDQVFSSYLLALGHRGQLQRRAERVELAPELRGRFRTVAVNSASAARPSPAPRLSRTGTRTRRLRSSPPSRSLRATLRRPWRRPLPGVRPSARFAVPSSDVTRKSHDAESHVSGVFPRVRNSVFSFLCSFFLKQSKRATGSIAHLFPRRLQTASHGCWDT